MERPGTSRMSPVDRVSDVVESVKAYAVQETVGPARGAARWLAYGTLASIFMGTGVVFLGMAALRLSQDAGGTVLDGAWSFVHYLVSGLVLSASVAVALSRISKNSLSKD
ncbi:MAG: hypothetical protein ACKODP_08615 [Actinomycetota bacterium]